MNTLFVFILAASTAHVPVVPIDRTITTAPTQPQLKEVPKGPNGLTLYNRKGEVVARCGKKDDAFADCKMEPDVTLDDLMNAWVHVYQDMQK